MVAVGPDDEDQVCVAAGGAEQNRLPLTGKTLQSLAVSADGELTVVGTEFATAGSAVVYAASGMPVDEARLPAPVTAVGFSPDATRVVAADGNGTVIVFGLTSKPRYECSTQLPRTERVVAADLGTGSNDSNLLAVASATGVFVFSVDDQGDQCAELVGGFDLERDEGRVLDLAFTEDGRLTVLESDLFVFTFDPLAAPQAVVAQIDELASSREWAFDDARCQELVGRSCPSS